MQYSSGLCSRGIKLKWLSVCSKAGEPKCIDCRKVIAVNYYSRAVGAIFFVVAQRESYTWNLKRVYRIYKEL